MMLLQAKNISKSYQTHSLMGSSPARLILDDVSLSIQEGETIALLGRSGCGKSTLARQLCGLEHPETGEVFYQGTSTRKLTREQTRLFRRDVQMVFQDSPSAVDPRMTVGSIIEEPLRHLTELKGEQRLTRIVDLLVMVELPKDLLNKLPSQISGGQLQRVCIARALGANPKLIILDEAVSNLDTHLQASALKLLTKLQDSQKVSYLFVTHDLRLVERFADRILVMEDGRFVEEQNNGDIQMLSHPASIELKNAILPALPQRKLIIEPA
ncbi:nickel import ATP-binding protein NikE [Ochrobactrum sp. S1502_03]|uniref:nickel import ATP-binding protein NikE n=1 Tax=Ochrobactrum sp. S1502_03 TaxID=3108451 RepID=UPI0037C6FBB1